MAPFAVIDVNLRVPTVPGVADGIAETNAPGTAVIAVPAEVTA